MKLQIMGEYFQKKKKIKLEFQMRGWCALVLSVPTEN